MSRPRTANEILDCQTPDKRRSYDYQMGYGSNYYGDKTQSINYDPEKERKLNELREKVKKLQGTSE